MLLLFAADSAHNVGVSRRICCMARIAKEVDKRTAAAKESPAGGAAPDHDSIAALAHQLWLARGCPIGSDLDDWYLAESMLKHQEEKEPAV
jgi:hypothetical protein